jgi:O-antigen ligase
MVLELVTGSSSKRGKSFARLLERIVFFALLTLIPLVAIPYGGADAWWQAFFDCAVFGLAALWLIEGYLKGSWNFSAYFLLLPLFVLTGFALLQTVPLAGSNIESFAFGKTMGHAVSADPHGTRRWAAKMLALILVAAMLLRYTSEKRRLVALIYVIVGVALASAIFGLLRETTLSEVGFNLPKLPPGSSYGQFINKNHFAFLMEMALGLILGLAVWRGLTRDRLVVSLAVALMLGGMLVLANSRGGVLSLLSQLLCAAVLLSARKPVGDSSTSRTGVRGWAQRFVGSSVGRALLIVCFLAVVVIGIKWIGGAPLAGALERMPKEVAAQTEGARSSRRLEIWQATWQLIKDHPVAGVGFGGYWMAITGYNDVSGESIPQEAHDDYLELFASGGLIAGILGGWFLFTFIRCVRRQQSAPDKYVRAARLGALVGLSGVAVHSLVDYGLHIPINAVICTALVVIAITDLSRPPAVGSPQVGSGRAVVGSIGRLLIVSLGVLALFWCIWTTGREGLAQLLADHSLNSGRIEEADQAIRLSPALAEGHHSRASLLYNRKEFAEASREYERAVSARPQDYALWLKLGRARDQAGEPEGAIVAFRESKRLAPFYAQPHWQLGNTLYRLGRRDEAFAELRLAMISDSSLIPAALDLAWAAFNGDARAIEQAIQPQSASMHVALARFFVTHGKISEAVQQFRAAGGLSDDDRRGLLKDLFAARRFLEAHEVWSSGQNADTGGTALFVNGGFESEIKLDDPGFGWQPMWRPEAVSISSDIKNPHSGARSLRVDWSGKSDPSDAVISQLLLVEPGKRYRLSFAARTEELITGGLPVVVVIDASNDKNNILIKSKTLPPGTNQWQTYISEFKTTETTNGVFIRIRRENCDTSPCPAFGHVWFDDFSLEQF